MPQLDFLIVFPQIFWLIFFFILFYFILSYFFLPFFLRTILIRTKFIKQNSLFEAHLITTFLEKQQIFFNKLNKSLIDIHSKVFSDLLNLHFTFLTPPFKKNYVILNKKIFEVTKKSLYFCNSIILESFVFFPSMLNKKT